MHTVNLNEAHMMVKITITTRAKRPKKRRHARGGLRRLIIHKYTSRGVAMKGNNTDAPWTFTMPVTRATR